MKAGVVLVSDIAAGTQATVADIAEAAAFFKTWPDCETQSDGTDARVPAAYAGYVRGALRNAIEERQSTRISAADAELTAAYSALRTAPREPRSATARLDWNADMLRRFTRVVAALTELVDAKVDADRMQPETAAQLRDEAARILRRVEADVHDGLRSTIRAARQLAA